MALSHLEGRLHFRRHFAAKSNKLVSFESADLKISVCDDVNVAP